MAKHLLFYIIVLPLCCPISAMQYLLFQITYT